MEKTNETSPVFWREVHHGDATLKLAGAKLTLVRGERCLFERLDFSVSDGELLLVEGPNGSGKTSLLRAVAGLVELEEGEVRCNGEAVSRDRQAFRSNLVWMGHRPGFKNELTLIENLRFESGLRPMAMTTATRCLARLGIEKLTDLPFRVLSAGQQRRVALARMLLAGAPIWLMDEPFTNLDAAGIALVVELLQEHLGSGGLAIVATHQPVALNVPIQRVVLQ